MREDGAELLIPRLGYKPLIGMIHLPPLPTTQRLGGDVEEIVEYAVNEARKLEEAGFQGAIVENYGDMPYNVDTVDPLRVAVMSVVAREVARSTSLVVGVNVLRNNPVEALAAAYAAGASFVRVNAYCETRLAPEGILEPKAALVEDIRSKLTRAIMVFADVDVKHSYGLTPVEHAVRQCVERGAMDAVIVSGSETGAAPPPGYVAAIRVLAGGKPLLLGSGLTVDNIKVYWSLVDGFIVGSSIKIGGTMSPIDLEKARRLARAAQELRSAQGPAPRPSDSPRQGATRGGGGAP